MGIIIIIIAILNSNINDDYSNNDNNNNNNIYLVPFVHVYNYIGGRKSSGIFVLS